MYTSGNKTRHTYWFEILHQGEHLLTAVDTDGQILTALKYVPSDTRYV